jgi:hypothetical protein
MTTAEPSAFDVSTPSPARMYDYFLGGENNFPVDREAGTQIKAALGDVLTDDVVWENRRFLQRAVRFLAEAGIDQFLDLGAGLPTQGNVHEIAQEVNPDARVVYVDNDPLVRAHGHTLLAADDATTVITADMREPGSILADPELARLIDFSRPVGVLFVAVFHFIRDTEDPAGIVTTFRERLVPGSYVALTHLTTDGPPAEEIDQAVEIYKRATSPLVFRPRRRIEAFFDGLDIVEPGLVRPGQWHPELGDDGPTTEWLYAGVGRLG